MIEAAANQVSRFGAHPGIVMEGHSTDYQPPQALKEMVEDYNYATKFRYMIADTLIP